MKIWHQSTVELDRCPAYRDALREHYPQTLADDVQVDLHGVPAGTWGDGAPSDFIGSSASYVVKLARHIMGNAVRAESEGYDAYVIGSYTEPFLRECRSLVDIPVVSMTESTLLVGCSFGRKIGIVTLNEENLWFQTNLATAHGLRDRVAGIFSVETDMSEIDIDGLFADPRAYADAFVATARKAIDLGADVIIPAEGLVAEIVHRAGVREVDGVCVLDGIGTPLNYAAMLARLRRATNIHPGRRWHYQKAPRDALDALASAMGTVGAPVISQ